MSLTLYDAIVPQYIQITEALAGVMKKGRDHYAAHALDLESLSDVTLCGDMLPFSFQINSIRHHSVNAVAGVKEGQFSPPKPLEKTDYASLEALVAETIADLKAISPEEVETLSGADVVFNLGEHKIPFTAEGFLLSFSLPNFFFHATTAYDILRMKGVPLGKRDYIGQLAIKQG